jgi:hypothetical protein
MKTKNIFSCFICIALGIILSAGILSCKNIIKKPDENLTQGNNQTQEELKTQTLEEPQTQAKQQETTGGVISLLDSLGVGDVPSYPGAEYDKELNEALGEFKNQLKIPDDYINVLYSVYAANDTPSNVLAYYNNTLKDLNWEKSIDLTYSAGGFMVWEKASNRDSIISYIISTGEIQYGNRSEPVILTGLIIPDYGKESEGYTETTIEGSEIGTGDIYFTNPTTPAGQGLLQTKSLDMGIEEWSLWLQEGSKIKGTNKVTLVDDLMFMKVVEFFRESEDPGDGGAAGIYKSLDVDLSKFSSVKIWLVGKAQKERGGNIANVNPSSFPEGAVQVRIKYLTGDNTEKEWYHSFFYSNIIYYDKLHYSLVIKDKWFWYISPNILELNDKPTKITEIRVYGFGWAFKGDVADVNIIAN